MTMNPTEEDKAKAQAAAAAKRKKVLESKDGEAIPAPEDRQATPQHRT